VDFRILATDIDEKGLQRARRACYPNGSLKDLPDTLRVNAFTAEGELYCLRPGYRTAVEFAQKDLRKSMPQSRFDMILCRNLAFTYFDMALQCAVLDGLLHHLKDGAALVIGAHETLPTTVSGLAPWSAGQNIFRYRG
jgi:chemotaxis protein methyltransferase CheR